MDSAARVQWHVPTVFYSSGDLLEAFHRMSGKTAQSDSSENPIASLPARQAWWLHALRRFGWLLVAVYFVAALGMLTVRYVIVPRVDDYRVQIAQQASRLLGQRVEIARVEAGWRGLRPRIELDGVDIYDTQNQLALHVPHVRALLSWRSLLVRAPRFVSIEVDDLNLRVQRTPDGEIHVAGLAIDTGPSSTGAQWMLQQGLIHLRDATVEWEDQKRDAPPLRLSAVSVLLLNNGAHHRFALRAQPPGDASMVDIRGDLHGRSIEQLHEWNGRLYAHFDYLDLAAWKPWIDYPFDIASGRGALSLWFGFAQDRIVETNAQIALTDVDARLAAKLPRLQMRSVQGELGVKESKLGFSMIGLGKPDLAYDGYTRHLSMVTREGKSLEPADLSAHWEPADSKGPERGDVRIQRIDLAPLAALSSRFPLPAAIRDALATMQPQGVLSDASMQWSGPLQQPTTYSARAHFDRLGMQPYAQWPGFTQLSGQFELSNAGGKLSFEGSKSRIDYPQELTAGAIDLDVLKARLNWRMQQGVTDVQIENIQAQNADVAASLRGSVQVGDEVPTVVDLTAEATRGQGAAAYKYIPFIGADLQHWLQQAIVGGTARDIRFRMKGAVDDFPYADAQKGQFKISAKIDDAQLRYEPDWPAINAISGAITFDGPSLRIDASRATVLGARLHAVEAKFDDVYHDAPLLSVKGEAQAPTASFLEFIAKSPVQDMLNGLTKDWRAEGNGQLRLALQLPLADFSKSKVDGSFSFANNVLRPGLGDASISKLSGKVDFSADTVSSSGLKGQYLGGPLNVQISSREDGSIVGAAQGSADATALAKTLGLPGPERLRGMLAYKASANSRKQQTSVVFESNLQGVEIKLPAPFNKAAAQSWPLRVEYKPTDALRGNLNLSLANGQTNVMTMQALTLDGAPAGIDRAAVAIGGAVLPKMEGPYIALAAKLDRLDYDSNSAVLDSGDGSTNMPEIGSVNLQAATLVAGGREFHDLSLDAHKRDKTWHAKVKARELAGEVSWAQQGRGALQARLQYLIHPELSADSNAANNETLKELPALDVIADRYVLNGLELGRLALQAVNERQGWRIQQATLSAPDGTAKISGLWQRPNGTERTELDVEIDSSDLGRYLARLGYPDTISQGRGHLKGHVGWDGVPYALDYPSLSGKLDLQAEQGQFVKLKPGIGKLLGVLSLQALPRRITLDFKDIFSEGFAFDRIEGSAKIAQGVISTEDLSMVGPSASVAITGSADIKRETQDLRVRVIPTIGDSLAAAAGIALLNPLVGIGALLTQRLLKDPIGQIFAFEYAISGSWDDPKVEKVRGPQQQAGEPAKAQ